MGRIYRSQQNLSQYDYTNANVTRPSSQAYVPSPHDMKINARLSPMHYKEQLRSFESDTLNFEKDGRQNSEKMLESQVDPAILGSFRLPADGSSRQNSFCLQADDTLSGKNTFDYEDKGAFNNVENLSSRCTELETSNRIEGVKTERLEEHVKVLDRNIKELETKLEQANVNLRKERIKAAKLEKSLEKAQIDMKSIVTPNHSTSGKLDLTSVNTIKDQKLYNQESIILGADESPYGRRNLRSAKDGARNTPSKTNLERRFSWKHLTEKGPTIYMG